MTGLIVIGGGLAGSEAAWQAAQHGCKVRLYEMRPEVSTGAQQSADLAELVCSNSLGPYLPDRASGVLKNELRRLGSMLLECANAAALPAGTSWVKEAPRQERKIDISRIIKYAPPELVGREAETKILADAWAQAVRGETPRPHVLTFVALGGEGKTSLVAKWAADLAHRDWPGCEAAFAWTFYSQGTREQLAASSDLFLASALTFFGDPEMARSAQGAFDKGRRLAQLVGQRRALLVLEGLEPLQFAPGSPAPGELKDQGLAALLKGLAGSSRGLCVVTTRYSLPDLKAFWQTTAPEHALQRLSLAAGVALLKKLGVQGSERPGASRRSEPTRDQ